MGEAKRKAEAVRIDWSDEEQWIGIPAEPLVIDGKVEEPAQIPEMPAPGSPFVAIGVPALDFVDTEFSICFAMQMASFRGLSVMMNSQGCYVDEGRMSFVDGAKRRRIRLPDGQVVRPSHLMQLDSDMTFPHNALQRLLAHKVKDVVGCMYSRRVHPYTNIGLTEDSTIEKAAEGSPLIPMKLLPTGILLTHMSVFDRMPEFDADGPVFGYRWMPEIKKYEREDVRFCRLVRENGMKIWLDVGLSHQIGHVGKSIYMVDEASKRIAAISGMKQVSGNAAPEQPSEPQPEMIDVSKAVPFTERVAAE